MIKYILKPTYELYLFDYVLLNLETFDHGGTEIPPFSSFDVNVTYDDLFHLSEDIIEKDR